MSVHRYSAKRDANEKDLVSVMEAMGASVDRLPGGKGRPDLLVGYRGHTILVEVKTEDEELNDLQVKYHRDWKGAPIYVASTVKHVIEVLRLHSRRIVPCPNP